MRRVFAATSAAVLVFLLGAWLSERSHVDAQQPASTDHDTFAPAQNTVSPKPRTHLSAVDYVTVRAATVTPRMEAYGQIEPIAVLRLNAAEEGVVAGLNAIPGMHVRTGQQLAYLSGPTIQLAMQQSEANVRSARAQVSATQKTLAIEREQLASHLSTRAAVQQAESAAAQAQTNFDNAQSHFEAVRRMRTVSAPSDGIVLTVNASNGELVSAGQPVVTLQAATQLWLKASYYGADLSLIRVGMKGLFSPADGTAPIPVRVRAISGAMNAGEGETVGLTPTAPSARWVNGEFGTVTLRLPPRKLVAVPTRSLILNEGKWWVLLHTPQGDHAQEVVPGPSRGWNTFLESGVTPGSQVVVEGAYLLFHRGIARLYQPPG